MLSLFKLFSLLSCDVIEIRFCFCSNAVCFRLLHTFWLFAFCTFQTTRTKKKERGILCWRLLEQCFVQENLSIFFQPHMPATLFEPLVNQSCFFYYVCIQLYYCVSVETEIAAVVCRNIFPFQSVTCFVNNTSSLICSECQSRFLLFLNALCL